MTENQYATFVVQGLFFGIDVLRVQEVLRYQEMTRIALAPPVTGGLINLRGQIVTAIDMRCRLGLPPRDPSELPLNIVIRTEDGPVSLLVDEIGDVIEVDPGAAEAPPGNLSREARELIAQVYKLEHRLLLVLNPDKTLDIGGLSGRAA